MVGCTALQVAPWSLITPEGNSISRIWSSGRKLQFGMRGGVPVTGDFNGDGITDVGVFFRGQWFIDLNGNGVWDKEDLWAKLGYTDDQPSWATGTATAKPTSASLVWPGRATLGQLPRNRACPTPTTRTPAFAKTRRRRHDVAPHGCRSHATHQPGQGSR